MSKIQLYIATTIDRFIARENGDLDWLNEIPNSNNLDYGYSDFYEGIETVIMGRKTYEEILGFDVEYPYKNSTSYIFSSQEYYPIKTEKTFLVNELNDEFIQKIRQKSQKNIWIIGGGKLIAEFLNFGAIDEMTLFIAPIVLGKGIKLFPDDTLETKFELVETKSFDTGLLSLTYQKQN